MNKNLNSLKRTFSNKSTVKTFLYVAIIILIIYCTKQGISMINSILEGLGLKDSAEDKIKKEEEAQLLKEQAGTNNAPISEDYWSSTWWKTQITGAQIITKHDEDIYVKRLYDSLPSFTFFNKYPVGGDFATINGVFGELRYKSQVSYLCFCFSKKHSINLKSSLNKWFPDDIADIYHVTNKLPLGGTPIR